MKRGLAIAVLLALAALPLAAESHGEEAPRPIIWVSFLKAPPGASQGLVELIKEQDGPLWTQLLKDGQILEWGIAQPITHRQGGEPYDVAEWATFPSWSAVDAFVAAFMARQTAMSEEDRKAEMEAYMSAVVPGSHYDNVHEGIQAATDGKRPGYLKIGFHKATPGMSGKVTKMWKKNAQPILQKLLDDGKIQGYGLFGQALHGDHSWTHGSWVTMSGLGGQTAVNGAFDAAEKARSEEENKEMMKFFQEAFEPEAHWDELLAVVHYDNGSDG